MEKSHHIAQRLQGRKSIDFSIGVRYICLRHTKAMIVRIVSMSDGATTPDEMLPLPVAQLHILLALADGEKHGYAVMREVESMTGGEVTMGPGTLYGAVKKMVKAGLIEETDERPDPEMDDERRRYYRTTGLGVRVLDAETARMEGLVETARVRRTRRLNPGTGNV